MAEEHVRIGLDNSAFGGRLRQVTPQSFARPAVRATGRKFDENFTAPRSASFTINNLTPPLATQPVTDARPALSAAVAKPKALLRPRRVQPQAEVPKVVLNNELIGRLRVAVPEPMPLASLQPQPIAEVIQISTVPTEQVSAISVQRPQPFAAPAQPKLQRSKVLRRQPVKHPEQTQQLTIDGKKIKKPRAKQSKLQVALVGMAIFIFGVGVFTSAQTLLTNHNATAQVSALSKKAYNAPATSSDTQSSQVAAPSTVKPPAATVANYVVGPTMPRYLNIPALGVHARVLSLGILSNGALGTPNNVFDTGWYNESSLPGQPGAMLIDGHVSSWTSHGVFYGIKLLNPGDTMQVVRGDGTVFNYKVVRSQTFSDTNVDMQSAVTPVTAGKPGLNLITCTGKLKPGTSEFNERVLVYAEQE